MTNSLMSHSKVSLVTTRNKDAEIQVRIDNKSRETNNRVLMSQVSVTHESEPTPKNSMTRKMRKSDTIVVKQIPVPSVYANQ